MKQTKVYAILCIVGAVVPWLFLIRFLGQDEISIPSFFLSIFSNNVSSAVAGDLIVSTLAFFAFVLFEGRRAGVRHLWLYVAATLCVGLSFGLPLFLFHRARALQVPESE